MDKIAVQIGSYRLRVNGEFSQTQPIMKTATQRQAEHIADKIATVLTDCFMTFEKSMKGETENEK
jgi:hypothetical protein